MIAKNRFRTGLLICAAATLIAPALRAQIPPSKPEPAPKLEPYRDRIPHGFYLSAQANTFWHASYPGGYYLETDWPTDLQYAVVLLDSVQYVPAKTVPGIAFGFATGEDAYFGTIEISYSQATFADGPETFTGIFHLTDSVETTSLSFTQSARKISVLDATVRLGAFPFRNLGLAVYATGGAGYLTFSYQSPASAYAAAQGYNLDYLKQGYLKDLSIADPGNDQGNGAWSRSQIGFELGGGLEWFFGKRLSVRVDYRFITGSVKKKEYINGAIPVEADVQINYTFANRLMAALTYYF
jgi:opacity protein-like surface antigen